MCTSISKEVKHCVNQKHLQSSPIYTIMYDNMIFLYIYIRLLHLIPLP